MNKLLTQLYQALINTKIPYEQDILIFKVKLFREKERKRERKCQLTN